MQRNQFFQQVKNFVVSFPNGPTIKKLICLCRVLLGRIRPGKIYIPPVSPPFLGPGEKKGGYDRWCRIRDEEASFRYKNQHQNKKPLFSILVPIYDSQTDWFWDCIDSVRSQNYIGWELILSDDGSNKEDIAHSLKLAKSSDQRIRVIRSKSNDGISAATNKAARIACGEYLVFLDHDDILDRYALTAFAQGIEENKKNGPIDILYADEDCFDFDRARFFPILKPDYSPDLLLATNYIHHPVAIRRSLFVKLNGLRRQYDGSQDHDLLLRAEEMSNQIIHIPDVLYHMRLHPGSLSADPQSKPEAHKRDRILIRDAMKRRGITGTVSPAPEGYPGYSVVKRTMPEDISISVIIIPDGSSDINEILGYWKGCHCLIGQQDKPVPEQINKLAEKSESEILIFVSSEIRPLKGWQESIIPHITRSDIGLVTGKISYYDNKVHSCGLVLGTEGASGHWHHGWPSSDPGVGGWLSLDHEVSAVPWQFMGIRRKLFLGNGRFDTTYRYKGFDVDLALRLNTQLNLRHLAIPCAKVNFIHDYPEDSFERWDVEDLTLLWTRWGAHLKKGDPYLNPNFSLLNEDIRMVDKEGNNSVSL